MSKNDNLYLKITPKYAKNGQKTSLFEPVYKMTPKICQKSSKNRFEQGFSIKCVKNDQNTAIYGNIRQYTVNMQ